jgi:hypothetical protein
MIFDWIETHIWVTKAYVAAVMGAGAVVAAVIPDQVVTFVSAIALMVIGWVGTTTYKTSQNNARLAVQLAALEERVKVVETRQWDDHAHTM